MDRYANGVQQYYQTIRNRLVNYIKSDYLANSETLLLYADELLEERCSDDINIAKEPYIETSSSYRKVNDGIRTADIENNVKEVLLKLVDAELGIYSTPFTHQVKALTSALKGKDLFVSTGTGSGKTECFLWPIIARAIEESLNRPKDFKMPGVRTLIIYPMNALYLTSLPDFERLWALKSSWISLHLARGQDVSHILVCIPEEPPIPESQKNRAILISQKHTVNNI